MRNSRNHRIHLVGCLTIATMNHGMIHGMIATRTRTDTLVFRVQVRLPLTHCLCRGEPLFSQAKSPPPSRLPDMNLLAVALLAVAANAADDAVSAPYASLRGTQLAGDLAFDGTCPGSSAYLHAGMKVTTTAAVACQYVSAEVAARVNGQYSAWHDPHNNGTYTFDFDIGPGDIKLSRVTGDKKYTDKIIITLVDDGDAACKLEACSESQVSSLLDFGTNYCNLKMLYCGSGDGCKPVMNDFSVGAEKTEAIGQASVDMSACLKV